MPTGPKGQKRPAHAIGAAVMIAKIATGEIEDVTTNDGKNAAAVALGRMGGKARAEGYCIPSADSRLLRDLFASLFAETFRCTVAHGWQSAGGRCQQRATQRNS